MNHDYLNLHFPISQKTEIITNDDSSEQNYSVVYEGEQGDNTIYVTDVYQENAEGEDIQYQYENQDEATGNENVTRWSENSNLADIVKSIVGPNQEGPVILHVNNYDGVAVVQVADPQSYSTSESHELQHSQEEEEGNFLSHLVYYTVVASSITSV